MADDSEQPTQILSGAPTPPRGGTAMLDPHEPRLDEGGPGRGQPPVPPTGYGGNGDGDDWGGDDEGGDRKIAILAAIVGILVVVVLFLIFKPSDDTPAPTSSPTPAAATPTPTPEATATPTGAPSPSPEATPTPTPAPDGPSGGATVDGGSGSGPTLEDGSVTKFTVTQGDTVAFRVRNDADVAQEVHVHGYDQTFDVQPGETRSISFPASIAGIFEIEFEQSGSQIGELTVEP